MHVSSVEVIEAMARALGATAATADNNNNNCKAGHFVSAASGTCKRCAPGFVAQGNHCRICPSGTFSNMRNTACVPCQSTTDTWVWDITYEPKFATTLLKVVGASSPSSCVSRSRATRALSSCVSGSVYGYGTVQANAIVTGEDVTVTTASNTLTVANVPRVDNLSFFKDVPLNETHTFVITNRDVRNPMFISDVVLDAAGSNTFTIVRNPDTVVNPGLSTTFAIQYHPVAPSTGNGHISTVQIKFCDGFSSTANFRIRGTTVTIPLELTPDTYTTDWASGLSASGGNSLLANDRSFQGTLVVTGVSALNSVVVPTAMVKARALAANSIVWFPNGNFTLTFDPFFSGTVSFTYTASNGFATATSTATVTVNPVSSNIVCPNNITIDAPLGFNSTPIAWERANASYGAVVVQTAGPAIGSIFSYFDGPVTISYLAQSVQGLLATRCNFTVRVTIRKPIISCPAISSVTINTCTAPLSYAPATALGYMVPATLQAAEGASGQLIVSVGVQSLTFTVTDGIGQTATCRVNVAITLRKQTYQGDQLSGYVDFDKDGYGAVGSNCTDYSRDPNNSQGLPYLPPSQLVSANNLDCDDNNPFINPAANEICDGLDNNCNGLIDEGTTCVNQEADKPLEAAPIVFRPQEALDSLPSLPPTIITIKRPFTIPVFTSSEYNNAANAVSASCTMLCLMLLALLF
jgi:hypothetical protein